jgi:hypothetical protein
MMVASFLLIYFGIRSYRDNTSPAKSPSAAPSPAAS